MLFSLFVKDKTLKWNQQAITNGISLDKTGKLASVE